MNNLCFTGNLGKDCRMGSAGSTAVCNFSVAVKSGFGDKQQTIWVDVALWGKQAEGKLPDYLVKGQQVAVTGELGTREHDGKTYITCRASSVDLIGKRDESAPAPSQHQRDKSDGYAPQKQAAQGYDDGDVPF